MSNFTPKVVREFDIDGDTVTVGFRRLTREQFGKLAPYSGTVDQEKVMEMIDVVEPMLNDVVFDFKGLTDSEGNPLTLTQVMGEAYFLGFVSDLISAVVEESVLDAKKPTDSNEK